MTRPIALMRQPAMETHAHLQLKRLALRHLRSIGCAAVAMEVRCPISRFRVDVAGYQDSIPVDVAVARSGRQRIAPRTHMIECKQSRADFFRDCEDAAELAALRDEYAAMRQSIEVHRIRVLEPHLQERGGTLFPEMDAWDFSASRLPGYRKVLLKIRRLEQKLHGHTKFCTLRRYALADRLFILAPEGMLGSSEVPAGWGLLECPELRLQDVATSDIIGSPLKIRVEAPMCATKEARRLRLLRNIAVAASMQLERAQVAAPTAAASGERDIRTSD